MNFSRFWFLLIAALFAAVSTEKAFAQLSLHVDRASGATQLINDPLFSAGPISFDAYLIKSAAGSLNPASWFTLQSQGISGWDPVGNASENIIGEYKLVGGTVLAIGQSLSIGNPYNAFFGIEDLEFEYAITGGSILSGPVSYVGFSFPPVGLTGDYNNNGIVSHADYSVLGDTFGSVGNLSADGNGDGAIDIADYHVYAANFGNTALAASSFSPGLPFTLSANTTEAGNTKWFVQFHDVQGSLAGHLNIATDGAVILSAAAGADFHDDGAEPVGVPGFTTNGTISQGIVTSGTSMFAALGSTLGAPSPGPDRQFLTFETQGTLATEISIQGAYGYQGVDYPLSGLFSYGLGSSAAIPLLPDETNPGEFIFESVPSGLWFDPPLVDGFEYVMDSASLFTAILDFPPGFAQPFEVVAEGSSLGTFGPGQAVDFVALLGHGVEQFVVSGITPLADAGDPAGFPLKLAFDTPTASFRMLAVPEPCALLLALCGWATAFSIRRRRSFAF